MENFAKSRWLIIPIELQIRELESRLLLACAAARRGYQALVGNQATILKQIHKVPRGIIFEKSIAIGREERIRKFDKMGFRACNSDEESTSIYFEPERFCSERLNGATLTLTQVYCCWSDLQKSILDDQFPALKNHLITTGTTRTDIWRPEFRQVFKAQSEKIKQKYGRFILFNSNFAHVIHHSGPNYMIETMERFGVLKKRGMREHFERYLAEGRSNLVAYEEVLPQVADWFPDHTLIIRPHPSDDVEHWRRVAAAHPKIEVIREGGSTPWILASEAMFHHGCSTGYEAGLLGQPSVFYGPSPDIAHDNHISTKTAPQARTVENLRRLLDLAIAGRIHEAETSETLDRYFAALQGRFAFERILDALDRVDIPLQKPTPDVAARDLAREPFAKRARRFVKRLQFGKPAPSPESNKWPGVDLAELERLAGVYCDASPLLGPVVIEPIHDDVFWVRAA